MFLSKKTMIPLQTKNKMNPPISFLSISISLIICLHLPPMMILAQQPYVRESTTACDTFDNSTSSLGYICNGLNRTCQAYLTYRAQPPYDSVSAVSNLFGVDPSQISRLNSVRENAVFQMDRTVLVPVNCSCSGQYYQVNRTYTIRPNDNYFRIANNTFQGLSTCQALQRQNSISARNLYPGQRITVPLRCACPTKSQVDDGVNYLLSYLVTWNQDVSSISLIFNVDIEKTLAANGLSDQDTVIYPFTTLLVPLKEQPTSSEVTAPQPPPPPSENQSPPISTTPGGGGGGSGGSSKSWVYAVVGVIGGLVLASVVGVIVYCIFFGDNNKRRKNKPESVVVSSEKFESVEKPMMKKEDLEALDLEDDYSLESISTIAQSLKVYTFEELKTATEDFDPSFLIKGSVYRGVINGDFAAIKKMNGDVSKEIGLLNKINHFNLIRLSGVCFNEGDWYLVYEYASNGSLDQWICDEGKKEDMDWNMRLKIASDIANGLTYLHRYTSPPCVHKDLNSSNVLLDQDYRAKIANFGLARSTEEQEGHFALTTHIVGTKGYMAPEYLENGLVSPKLDVYAFGVLMLEILTGKEVSVLHEEVNMQLSEIIRPVLSEDDAHETLRNLVDPSLQGKYDPKLALEMLRLIDKCLEKDPSDRPNMDEISQSLSRISSSSTSGEWAI